VTEAQKWHISGYIIDASPEPEKAPVDYFEKLEAKRKEELIKQFAAEEVRAEETLEKKQVSTSEKVVVVEEGDKQDYTTFMLHYLGILIEAIGVYFLLRAIFN